MSSKLRSRPSSATVSLQKPTLNKPKAVVSDEDEVITVNIGGCCFSTTKRTLAKPIPLQSHDYCPQEEMTADKPLTMEHFFCVLYSGKFLTTKDNEGRIFVNRDGTHFRYILNYLRAEGNVGKTVFPWCDLQAIDELIIEAEFYNLSSLANFLRGDSFWSQVTEKFSKRTLECAVTGDGFTLCNNQMTIMITKPYQTVIVRNVTPLYIVNDERRIPRKELSVRLQHINYCEVRVDGDLGDYLYIGIMPIACPDDEKALVHKSKQGFAFSNHGSKVHSGSYSNYGEVWKDGDYIGMWLDAVQHKLYFFKNGLCLGCAFTMHKGYLQSATSWFFVICFENRTDRPRITLTSNIDRPDI